MAKKITVFTSSDCTPCEEINRLLEERKFEGEIQLVNIDDDEGFEMFNKAVLSKGEGGVPSAYSDGEKCEIQILDDDFILFKCPKDDSPSSAEEKQSPSVKP